MLETEGTKKKSKIAKFLVPAWMVGSLVVVGILGFMLYKANKNGGGTAYKPEDLAKNSGITYNEGTGATNPQQQIDPETQKIIDQVISRVKELAKLEGEAIPDVARIGNAESLREKDTSGFYKNAEDGDFVVRYPNVVFLYSPSQDKIVQAAEIKPKEE